MGKLLSVTPMSTSYQTHLKGKIKPELRIGPVSLTFFMCILACILALFYLAQANQAAIKGYEIKKLEDKKAEIFQEREQLMVEAATLQSIKNIETEKGNNNLVPTRQINYWPATIIAAK